MNISIQIPHDYNSESDYRDAITDVYGPDEPTVVSAEYLGPDDDGAALYERMYDPAIDAGLALVADTVFGAEWRGTREQIEDCIAHLPSWASFHFDPDEA